MKWKPKSKANAKSKPWQLQEAKAKFSEVFELAMTAGPQYVTRRNRDEVVIAKRSDFERLKGRDKRPSLIEALLACPKVPGFKIPRRDKSDVIGRRIPNFE